MDSHATNLTQVGASAPTLPATPANEKNAPRVNSESPGGISLPVVVSEWQRNSREIVRVKLDRYRGRETIDVRTWYPGEDDEWKPGKGLTLAVKNLPALAEGLNRALEIAQQSGLLEGGAE